MVFCPWGFAFGEHWWLIFFNTGNNQLSVFCICFSELQNWKRKANGAKQTCKHLSSPQVWNSGIGFFTCWSGSKTTDKFWTDSDNILNMGRKKYCKIVLDLEKQNRGQWKLNGNGIPWLRSGVWSLLLGLFLQFTFNSLAIKIENNQRSRDEVSPCPAGGPSHNSTNLCCSWQ